MSKNNQPSSQLSNTLYYADSPKRHVIVRVKKDQTNTGWGRISTVRRGKNLERVVHALLEHYIPGRLRFDAHCSLTLAAVPFLSPGMPRAAVWGLSLIHI